ncbi:MAG: cytochrome B [Rhizobiales bacterium]|nr:cytochrome B [Hyphomicrobiales bacterium]MBA69188.1 cytochrome B [Hyphomicrobiales bacterium]
MLRRLYDWTMSLAATRHAEKALFGVSFIESSIFPIPPDVLLIPMVLARRESWLRLALICTAGSVLGAFLGYAIGMFLFETVGQPILAFYGKAESFQQLSAWYNTSSWGGWAIFGAAITPFPYKVVTIFSGTTGFNLALFAVISVIGRGFRFFLVAGLLYHFGEPIRIFIEKYLNLLFVLFIILLLGGFYAIKFVM